MKPRRQKPDSLRQAELAEVGVLRWSSRSNRPEDSISVSDRNYFAAFAGTPPFSTLNKGTCLDETFHSDFEQA